MERLSRAGLLQGQLGVAEDHSEHVVEVVCHSAGQSSNGFHFLCLGQLLLEFRVLCFGSLSFGKVRHKRNVCQAF